MHYDDDPRYDTQDEPMSSRSGGQRLELGLGLLGLTVAVGLSVYLLRGMNDPVEVASEAPPSPPVVEAPAIPLEEAVAAHDAEPEPVLSPAEQLRAAQSQVDSLQTELDARDVELARLRGELAQRDAGDAEARERYRLRMAALEHDMKGLREALARAQDERDTLRKDLKEALAEVDRQVAENTKLRKTATAFKEANTENLWYAFTNNAKVRICDRGTHNRRESCMSEVDAWFDEAQHATFTSCVNTAQTMPILWEGDGQEVPPTAHRIAARDRERKDDWYVVYCDPTLPEAVAARDITDESPQLFAMMDP